jgi:CelD/BcsL family acetyltransferase involved in cellulose biosynthesis
MAACAAGQGFAYELIIDGDVAAQMMGFTDGDKAYCYRIGMDNRFMKCSPGWLISYHVMADFQARGFRSFVLGRGSEEYKYQMGGVETTLVGIGATRGIATWMARFASSRPAKAIDSRFQISANALSLPSKAHARSVSEDDEVPINAKRQPVLHSGDVLD